MPIQFKATAYEGPWMQAFPLTRVFQTGDWRFQRPVVKVGKCRQCGLCYLYCPTGCISDRGTYFDAELDFCKGCGICARICPVDAIRLVREVT